MKEALQNAAQFRDHERVRVKRMHLALACTDDLDEHVRFRKFSGQRDLDRVLALRQFLPRGFRRLHDAEAPRVLVHERVAAEGKLRVHQVVVDRHVAEILPCERDGLVLHLEVERQLGGRSR